MAELPPAETCVQCGRRLAEVGGRRISSTTYFGLMLLDADSTASADQNETSRRIEVKGEEGKRVARWWGDRRWSEPMLETARSQLADGRHPWFCQGCAGRTCKTCGHILRVAQGSEVLHDDGTIRHQMIAPVAKLCTNPACEKYGGPAA